MSKQLTNTAMQQITRNAIAMALVKNRNAVISLLRKYGVNVDEESKNNHIIVAILIANRDNEKFRKELKDLLLKTTSNNTVGFTAEKTMNFFFTAENGQNFFNFSDGDTKVVNGETLYYYKGTWVDESSWSRIQAGTQNVFLATKERKEKTGVGKFLSGNLDAILNTGLATLSAVITNKSNSKLADKALALEAEKTKQAQMAAIAADAGSGSGVKKGLSTGAKIGIGLSIVAVLGVIVYLVVKKKG